MALPKIMYPQFDILVPSQNKKFKFRQFLVKEEKILLTAKSSNDDSDILTAISQIVQNCSLNDNFNVNKIAIFDLEYIFVKLRGLSISNKVNLSYRDFEDNQLYEFEVDLDKIEIEKAPAISNKIMINDKIGVNMKYPSASIYSDKDFLNAPAEDATVELIVRCIDKVFDDETVYDPTTFSREEILEFVNGIDVVSFGKINDYLSNSPKMKYVIKYKNSLGNDRQIVLSTINDFFTLR
jgi:hypothetical protein